MCKDRSASERIVHVCIASLALAQLRVRDNDLLAGRGWCLVELIFEAAEDMAMGWDGGMRVLWGCEIPRGAECEVIRPSWVRCIALHKN